MSEILDALFKKNFTAEPVDNIHFVFVSTTDNKVVEKVSAGEQFFENIMKVQNGELIAVRLDNPADAEVGFVYTPDEGV